MAVSFGGSKGNEIRSQRSMGLSVAMNQDCCMELQCLEVNWISAAGWGQQQGRVMDLVSWLWVFQRHMAVQLGSRMLNLIELWSDPAGSCDLNHSNHYFELIITFLILLFLHEGQCRVPGAHLAHFIFTITPWCRPGWESVSLGIEGGCRQLFPQLVDALTNT